MKGNVRRLPRNPLVGLNHWEQERAARSANVFHRTLGGSTRTVCHHCPATFADADAAAWHAMRLSHLVVTTTTSVSAWGHIDALQPQLDRTAARRWGES